MMAKRYARINWTNTSNTPLNQTNLNRMDKGIDDCDNAIEELYSSVSSLNTNIGNKVDKVSGKGLSTNDYTNAEKNKLSGIASGAQVNTVTGIKGNSESSYRIGNVNITPANIGASPDEHSHAISGVTGLQSALNGKAQSTHSHTKAQITDFPDSMKNPSQITFTGAVTGSYDGSSPLTIDIPTGQSSPEALTLQLNGGTTDGEDKFTYNGGTPKSVNITPSSIGAASTADIANKVDGSRRQFTLTNTGWYRIAEHNGNHILRAKGVDGNSFIFNIRKRYSYTSTQTVTGQLVSRYTASKITIWGNSGYVDISKIRHTVDNVNNTTYLEMYYNSNAENTFSVDLSNVVDVLGFQWFTITPVLTQETVEGVDVYSIADLTTKVNDVLTGADIVNNQSTTVTGFSVDATQLNPNVANSFAAKIKKKLGSIPFYTNYYTKLVVPITNYTSNGVYSIFIHGAGINSGTLLCQIGTHNGQITCTSLGSITATATLDTTAKTVTITFTTGYVTGTVEIKDTSNISYLEPEIYCLA